jgi:hypothetical protein
VRISILTVCDLDGRPLYRLCESDGSYAINWLPGLEPDDPYGVLDCGGYDQRLDAQAFKLGVDRERALFGLLPGVTVEDIDAERAQLDNVRTINGANRELRKAEIAAAFDRTDDAPQLDFGALLEAVSEPAAPGVLHRRRRVA